MRTSKRIVVIGAGVIGLSVAWRLAEAGAAVTIVEAAGPGAGTSATSFAWVNASSKAEADPAYFRLNALGLEQHRSIGPEGGLAEWFHDTGDIELARGSEEAAALARKADVLLERGYAVERLTAARLEALEPGTRLAADDAAIFFPHEGWADVARMVTSLLDRARHFGATVVGGDPAREVLRPGREARGVVLASGTVVEADAVVVALGRWTSDFAETFGADIPLVASEPLGSRAIGLLARVVTKQGTSPRRLFQSRAVNWSPLGTDRALLASDAGDAAVARDRSSKAARVAAEVLIAEATALNPLFAGAEIEELRLGIRALPRDNVTICGPVGTVPSLYVVVTHSGVTLAPLLGRYVADEVLRGRETPILGPFRPERFVAPPDA